jgi:hypothetical protein
MKPRLKSTLNIGVAHSAALTLLAYATALGCGNGEEWSTSNNSVSDVYSEAVVVRSELSAVDKLQRLFERMDAVGPGSEEAYTADLNEFLSVDRPVEALRMSYEAMPKEALGNRWRAVYVAGQIKNQDSLSFLEQVALSAPEFKAKDSVEDQTFRMRYTAAVGLVASLKAGVKGADASVDKLLMSADPQIAQMAGVELFSVDLLTESRRQLLRNRGVAADFRRLTEAEHLELFTEDPARSPHEGPSTRTRPLSTSVPELKEDVP